MERLKGRCLCGTVRYEVNDNFLYAGYCHCSDCRRFSGSAFSAMAGIPTAEFQVVSGVDAIQRYVKSANTVLCFCLHCGSSLCAEKPNRGMVHVRLGTLDDCPSLRPHFHSYVASKAEWDVIADKLPQHPAGRS